MMLPYDLAFTGSRARRRQRLIHKPLLFGYRPLGKSPPCVSPRRVRLDPSLRPAGRRAAGRQYRRGARHGIFQGHRPNQGGRAQRRRVGSRGLRCGRRQDGAKIKVQREKRHHRQAQAPRLGDPRPASGRRIATRRWGYRNHQSFFCRHGGLYTDCRRKPTTAINGLRNKPLGPGGGTRRLHQGSVSDVGKRASERSTSGLIRGGGEIGSTRV